MAGEDKSSRSRRRDTESVPRVRKSHKTSRKDDPAAIGTATQDKPADVDALREARLKYLETPPEERRTRMKYVYDQTIKVKEKEKGRKSEARSVVSTTRRKSESSTKRRKTKDEREGGAHSDEEYVYGKPRKETSTSPKKKDPVSKSRSSTNVRKATTRAESGKAVDRDSLKRRHTEPVRRRDPCDDDVEETVVEITPPRPRRSSTLVEATSRPPLKRSATTVGARADRGESSVVADSARKPSGAFSSIFFAPPPPERLISCLTCGADDVRISRSARLPCKHRMCHSCLKRIFKMSITDPAHMPPRCCQEDHIDLKHVDKLFDNDFKKTFNRKYLEYTAKNRIYCVNRSCGEWIRPKDITVEHGRKTGKCKKCGTQVCAICNNKAHRSRDCPKDPATKQFIETAKQKGWQKCYNCSAMVELKEGCNHMTCRCTAEFCMVCGLKWKSCDCPWFNYENVDVHLGNPIRYQEEMDRRRDQEQRDEALARRMQALGMDGEGARREMFGIGNAAGHHMNANFIQQAREALTANYQNAEQAARGLLNGWMGGRENPLPGGIPGTLDELNGILQGEDRRRDPADPPPAPPAARPQRRGTNRRRNVLDDVLAGGRSQTTEEREQDRRIQDWANGVAAS